LIEANLEKSLDFRN